MLSPPTDREDDRELFNCTDSAIHLRISYILDLDKSTLTEITCVPCTGMALSVDHLVSDIRKLWRGSCQLATQLDKYTDQLAQTDCSVLDTMNECLASKCTA